MFLAAVGVDPWFPALAPALRVLGFDFVARLLIVSQRQLIGQPARYWGAGWSPLGWQSNADLGWERAAE
jgi:hypothetical protein